MNVSFFLSSIKWGLFSYLYLPECLKNEESRFLKMCVFSIFSGISDNSEIAYVGSAI